MDLKGIMSDRERQTLYVITYMWNLKNKTHVYNKCMNVYNKTETVSQI